MDVSSSKTGTPVEFVSLTVLTEKEEFLKTPRHKTESPKML